MKNASAVAIAKEGVTSRGTKGTAIELAIPLSSLNAGKGSEILLNAVLRGSGLNDGFTRASENNPLSWMKIRLQ